MIKHLRATCIILATMTLLLGLVYPTAIWLFSQILFRHQSNGSLIYAEGKLVGSELIAQPFEKAEYFWPRPSMTKGAPYSFMSSGGSQHSPANQVLIHSVEARAERIWKYAERKPIPADLVTASGSGLDPHITVLSASFQATRIADARNIPLQDVHSLISEHTQYRTLGILGEPRVNVLELNLALDKSFTRMR